MAKGFSASVIEAVSIGSTAMQIFAKSPMSSRMRTITTEEGAEMKQTPGRDQIQAITIHASYLINYAKPLAKNSFEIRSLAEDVINSDTIGGLGAVLHMGKTLKEDPEVAEKLFVENIQTVLKKTDGARSAVILENMAGQGSEMCFRLEDYGRVVHALKKHPRVKCCIDTAHLVGAGYDLSSTTGAESALSEIGTHVGWNHVACIHFNDSKKPVESHVDRHQDIGYGTMGIPGMKAFARGVFKNAPHVPLLLETPQEHATYAEQMKLIRSWF